MRRIVMSGPAAVALTIATLVLHVSGSLNQGFFIVFLGTALILLVGIVFIFAMPAAPKRNILSEKAKGVRG